MSKPTESIVGYLVFNGKTFLAVIPARGGSKRLPRKNVLDLAGKPLISWTIESAKKSKYIDHCIVSTDDTEIAAISKKFNADVLIRPCELATDTATSIDVVIHVIESQNKKYDYVILLQPTSPLRTAHHIDEAIELLFEKNACAVISVCETDHSPLWSNTLSEDGSLYDFIRDDIKGKRSQDLSIYYRLNGAIYIYEVKKIKSIGECPYSEDSYAYKMNIVSSVDIDTYLDFDYAEFLMLKSRCNN